MVRWFLLSAFLGACFSPTTAPCDYACGTGGSCPTGLVCNAENRCALAANDVCATAPPDAPSDVVVIEARDDLGAPTAGVSVIVLSRDGDLITEQVTGADGTISVAVDPGASATVVRPSADPDAPTEVTSFVDLANGMHVISQVAPPTTTRPVRVEWGPRGDASPVSVYANCLQQRSIDPDGTGADLLVSATCGPVDIALFAELPNGAAGQLASAVSASSVSFPDVGWATLSSVSVTMARLPTEITRAQVTLAPWTAPERNGLFGMSVRTVVANTNYLMHAYPMFGIAGSVIMTPSVMAPGETGVLRYADRLPPGGGTYMPDLDGVLLPYVYGLGVDTATRSLAWKQLAPSGFTMATRHGTQAMFEVVRGGMLLGRWRVIAAPRETGSPPAGSIAIPDLPGTQPFELQPGDAVSRAQLQLFATAPEAMQATFEQFEVRLANDNVFAVPDVGFITRSQVDIGTP